MTHMETGKPRRRSIDPWVTLTLLAFAFIIILMVYSRLFFPNFLLGPFRVLHWFGWAGALYIALYIPAYHFLKRRHPKRYLALLRLHLRQSAVPSRSLPPPPALDKIHAPDLATAWPHVTLRPAHIDVLSFRFSCLPPWAQASDRPHNGP